MIFALPALCGLLVALARPLAAPHTIAARKNATLGGTAVLRWWPVAVACAGLQLYLSLGRGMDLPVPWRTGLLWGTYAALAAVVVANLRRRWMVVVAAGLLLNLVVMAANGGLMPVSPQTLVRAGNGHVLGRVGVGQPLPRSKDVILPVESTRLVWLSDVLVLPGRPGSFSPGDALIALGIFLVLQAASASPRADAGRQRSLRC